MGRKSVRLVYKLGGSLAITLPNKYCKENLISHGTQMLCEAEHGIIKVSRLGIEDLQTIREEQKKPEKGLMEVRKHVISNEVKKQTQTKKTKGGAKWQK